jgi:membrane fusion protein, macrolide-specific efflux system
MKLKLFLILVLIVAGGGAVFVSMGGLSANAAATTYLTSEATVGDVSDDVAATGSIKTVASYGLAFGAPARLIEDDSASDPSSTTWPVTDVSVAVGDRVTKGQTLAVADTSELERQLSGAVASRRSAALQVDIAQDQLDDADTTAETRQARISLYQAHTQYLDAEATQRDIQDQIKAAAIVAPIDGLVTAVNVVEGFDAPSGDAIVVDTATYEVTAQVVESDIESISLGQPATVTVDAVKSDVEGVVAAIAPTASAADNGGVVSYAVTVTLKSPPAAVRPGMSADITITTASATAVLTVPAAALNGTAGNYAVRVLTPAGVPEARQVDVGLVTSSLAEIKSGLAAGEAVITGTAADRAATTNNNGGFGPPGGGVIIEGGGPAVRGNRP